MSCIFQHDTCGFFQSLHITFTGRTVDHSCLAETTSTDTSSLDFQSYTILCSFDMWNNRCFHCTVFLLHIYNQLFLDFFRNASLCWSKGCDRAVFFIGNFIKRWNINSRDLSCCQKKISPAAASFLIGLISIKKSIINRLALSNIEQVKKRRQRLRIIRTGTTTDHNREILTTVRTFQRNPAEIQYLEDIGITHFITKSNTKKIKITDRLLGLQCK